MAEADKEETRSSDRALIVEMQERMEIFDKSTMATSDNEKSVPKRKSLEIEDVHESGDLPSGHTKRRPPSLVIDHSFSSTLHPSSVSTGSSSASAQRGSPPSSSNSSSASTSQKSTKSAKEIIQGLALHCVSPGLPPMNNEIMENIIRCKEIEKQQRILIAMRQKGSDAPVESGRYNNLAPEEVIRSRSSFKSTESLREPSSRMFDPARSDHQQPVGINRGRRANLPSMIRVIDPEKYREAGFERAIRSAPLVQGMQQNSILHSRENLEPFMNNRVSQRHESLGSIKSPPPRNRNYPRAMTRPNENWSPRLREEFLTSNSRTNQQQPTMSSQKRHITSATSNKILYSLVDHNQSGLDVDFQHPEDELARGRNFKRPRLSSLPTDDLAHSKRRYLEACSTMWDLLHEM
ncbi:uncharacterized protein V1516DRAFT_686591 [Lipomyces oligophaga]|uniref:uncharacterized protein n=1 Tax=Lipomyces oligophaga TaxID=45792 RepID=UPI0034CD785A